MSTVASSPRVWFITGASTGFGKLATELALSKGDSVVATLRKPEALKELQDRTDSSRLLVVKVDVTKPEDVTNAFAQAKQKFGRIDVVYNNAGTSIAGMVESTPEDVARDVFEVNFWAASRVSKEAVRFLRDENPTGLGGRILVISSYLGLNALPYMSCYAASRHAIEAVTQSLAQELDPTWNIKVTLVEAGAFRTDAPTKNTPLPIPPVYLAPTSPVMRFREILGYADISDENVGDPSKFVKKLYELSAMPNPPLRLLLGKDTYKYVEMQLKSLKADLEEHKSWSEDLLL